MPGHCEIRIHTVVNTACMAWLATSSSGPSRTTSASGEPAASLSRPSRSTE
jgi:hypothetical protein